MQVLVVLVALSVILPSQANILSKKEDPNLLIYRKECIDLSSVNPTLIDSLKTGGYPTEDKFKAFISCFAKKIGLVNEHDEFQNDVAVDKLTQLFDKTAAKKIVAFHNNVPEEVKEYLKVFILTNCCL